MLQPSRACRRKCGRGTGSGTFCQDRLLGGSRRICSISGICEQRGAVPRQKTLQAKNGEGQLRDQMFNRRTYMRAKSAGVYAWLAAQRIPNAQIKARTTRNLLCVASHVVDATYVRQIRARVSKLRRCTCWRCPRRTRGTSPPLPRTLARSTGSGRIWMTTRSVTRQMAATQKR